MAIEEQSGDHQSQWDSSSVDYEYLSKNSMAMHPLVEPIQPTSPSIEPRC